MSTKKGSSVADLHTRIPTALMSRINHFRFDHEMPSRQAAVIALLEAGLKMSLRKSSSKKPKKR
jgi:hypothetical protein